MSANGALMDEIQAIRRCGFNLGRGGDAVPSLAERQVGGEQAPAFDSN
jgi:hypothetical protein